MDLLPTIAQMTGASLEDARTIDGHDITPLLLAKEGVSSPTEVFLYYTSHGDLAGIRSGRWKLLFDEEQLFDLETDISEQWNKAGEHPERVAALAEHARMLDARLAEEARPTLTVETPLWDPEHTVYPHW